jgi:hypothetical protein
MISWTPQVTFCLNYAALPACLVWRCRLCLVLAEKNMPVNFVFLKLVMRYQVCLCSHSRAALAQNNNISEHFCIFDYFSTYFYRDTMNGAWHTLQLYNNSSRSRISPMPKNWYQVSSKSVLRYRTSYGWTYPPYPYRIIFSVQVWGYVWPRTCAGTANQD